MKPLCILAGLAIDSEIDFTIREMPAEPVGLFPEEMQA